ncbi:MAG TPA: NADH-quinone oxidoreductase subunit D [Anaeromyxobacteraceae bacterium]|nr:NADH-quinone oxidoreductase subunit D [Anaeromyxobacteraceae bacterium]
MEKLILRRVDRNNEEMLLNFGPQHPSTHGVLNFLVETDGEVMKRAIPDIGYLHRSLEKIGEMVGYPGFMPYTDRIDYVAAMFANEGYALAVERLLKIEAPPRAQYLRAISCELCRIASHLVSVGTMATDIGAVTPLLHAIRERETVNDLLEALCGARLTYNYHRIGGVAFDLPAGWRDRTMRFLDHFDTLIQEWDRLISFNEIYVKRLADVAVITREDAIDYGLVGPNLRGSGVDWDLRRDAPYGAYQDFRFAVPVAHGYRGTEGDCFDRYYVRVQEMAESAKIVRQALEKIPAGEITAKVPRKPKPEAGEALARVESARGEMAYYVVSDGTERAWRVRARTGSFLAMGIIEKISRGLMVADLVALIASLDVVAPETDR